MTALPPSKPPIYIAGHKTPMFESTTQSLQYIYTDRPIHVHGFPEFTEQNIATLQHETAFLINSLHNNPPGLVVFIGSLNERMLAILGQVRVQVPDIPLLFVAGADSGQLSEVTKALKALPGDPNLVEGINTTRPDILMATMRKMLRDPDSTTEGNLPSKERK